MQEKPFFEVKMQHNEDTLVALAHMQYDLFCTRNCVARSFLSVILILIALLYGGGSWWSLLIIGYGFLAIYRRGIGKRTERTA